MPQIGPKIRIGGTIGKIGQKVKIGAGKALSSPIAQGIIGATLGPGAAAGAGALGHALDTSHGSVGLGSIAAGGIGGYGAGQVGSMIKGGIAKTALGKKLAGSLGAKAALPAGGGGAVEPAGTGELSAPGAPPPQAEPGMEDGSSYGDYGQGGGAGEYSGGLPQEARSGASAMQGAAGPGGMSTLDKWLLGTSAVGGLASAVGQYGEAQMQAKQQQNALDEQKRQFDVPTQLAISRSLSAAPMRDRAMYLMSARMGMTPGNFTPAGIGGAGQQGGYDPGQMAQANNAYTPGAGGTDQETELKRRLLAMLAGGRNG